MTDILTKYREMANAQPSIDLEAGSPPNHGCMWESTVFECSCTASSAPREDSAEEKKKVITRCVLESQFDLDVLFISVSACLVRVRERESVCVCARERVGLWPCNDHNR